MVKKYTREITHIDYKNPEKIKKYYHRVAKQIYFLPKKFHKNYIEMKFSDYLLFNDIFLVRKPGDIVVPILGGG